jgi:PAS domain S-box-containing protein
MTAVAIGLTVVAARRLLRPVRNLVQTTAAIAQGNRATRASEHAAGEIGELARSFNHMADRLEESYASIERKVSDRTAELRARRRELENEITERRRTEEKLRESEERHRAITETAQDAIITADATGEIRFWNRAAEKIFGFTASEVLGKSMMDLIVPPQYHESKRKGLAAFARTGRGAALGKTLELTALRKDGTEFPIDISVSSYRDRDGLRAVALVRDITERKRIEEALQKEKNLLRSLVDVMEAMDVGVTIQDRDYTIVYQNRFMQNLAEGLGRKCYQVYEGCTRVCDGCPVKEAFRDGQPHTTERAVVTPEGEKVFAENTAHPIRDAAGQITSCFEVVRIVTDRKLAMERQQRLNDLQQRLLGPRELGDKLRMITDGVVSIFGADLCRIWMTRPGDRCDSGCMHADATEGPHVCRHRDRCLWLMASSGRYTHVDGEVHQRVPFGCYKIGRVAAGEEPKFLTNDVTTDPRVHNREWAKELGLVSFAGYQVRPPDKETIGVLALFAKHAISPDEDALLESLGSTVAQVVQKAMAEEALEAAHGRLVEASRQAGMAEVATGVLHNVGNVLNSVNVSASIVADKVRQSEVPSLAKAAQLLDEHADELATFLSEDERGKHLPRLLGALAESLTSEQAVVLKELQSLTDSVDHIKTIVSTQQSYAVASGLAESVSLASLVEDALRMNASSLQHRSIQVERDYAELPLIEVEKQKLLQILTNLIRNAGHALADQSGRDRRLMIQIAVSGDDRVRIEVADNGVGIPLENMTRIFAHGFTTKKEKGGRGFGLHHSALLAKEMGGSLTADSDGLGKGAIFTLELPLNLEEVAG